MSEFKGRGSASPPSSHEGSQERQTGDQKSGRGDYVDRRQTHGVVANRLKVSDG